MAPPRPLTPGGGGASRRAAVGITASAPSPTEHEVRLIPEAGKTRETSQQKHTRRRREEKKKQKKVCLGMFEVRLFLSVGCVAMFQQALSVCVFAANS